MKKSTKGAMAGSAAALLLMGGLGTHATWSDGDSVPGTALGVGHLSLLQLGCNGWLISGTASDPASVKIAPGGELTQVCTFEVDAVGANLKATLSVTSTSYDAGSDGDLTALLETDATYEDAVTHNPIGATTQLEDGDTIEATITVTLPATADESIQDLNATLDSITVTATQA